VLPVHHPAGRDRVVVELHDRERRARVRSVQRDCQQEWSDGDGGEGERSHEAKLRQEG
jgi:hypothetical protein